MQQQQQPPGFSEFQIALTPLLKQLDRLEERTRDLATRTDLEALRKELVARDSLEPQLKNLTSQITRVDQDRIADKQFLEKRIDEIEEEQMSKQDKVWARLLQGVGILAFILSLFEFISHYRFIP